MYHTKKKRHTLRHGSAQGWGGERKKGKGKGGGKKEEGGKRKKN